MNTYDEDPISLAYAIKSYVTQEGVNMQLIISAPQDDKNLSLLMECVVNYNTPTATVELNLIERHEKCPTNSYRQLNSAIKMIKGKWFAFASSNDIAEQNKFSVEISQLVSTKKKVCYSAFFRCNPNNTKDLMRFHDYDYNKHLIGNFVSDCATMSVDILKDNTPFKLRFKNFAFWDFWLRVYEKEGNVFIYNPVPTWNYNIKDDSMHIERLKDTDKVLENTKDKIRMLWSHV